MVCALKYREENNKREAQDERGQLYCKKLTMFWKHNYLTLNLGFVC